MEPPTLLPHYVKTQIHFRETGRKFSLHRSNENDAMTFHPESSSRLTNDFHAQPSHQILFKPQEKGRAKDTIAVSEGRNLRVRCGSLPRETGKCMAERNSNSGHLTPQFRVLLPWVWGSLAGLEMEAARYDTSKTCIPSACSTILSNTMQSWEWHRHFPDRYNEFSISACISFIFSFLSQFMLAVHSQPVPPAPREK